MFDKILSKYSDSIINFIPKIIPAIAIIICFYIIGRILKTILGNKLLKKNNNPALIKLIGDIIKNAFLMLGIISAFGTLGIDVSAMVAGLGLTGFALGFALKDIVSNVISGVLILIYQPFKVNNYILVDKYEGKVIDINLRYTTIIQDEKEILIPNSFLFSKPISVNK